MNPNDFKKALTAEDLIRRYNLDGLKTDRKSIKNIKESLNGTNAIIEDYVKAVTKKIDGLQNQARVISTWFFNGVPTLENKPANGWLTDNDKSNHLGDLYYDQDTGNAYRFILKDNEYLWFKIDEQDVIESLALANTAPDTTDNVRKTFTLKPTPPYEVGDIWVSDNRILYRCRAKRAEGDFNEVDWIKATDYSNDDYLKNVEAVLNQFKGEVTTNYVVKTQLETTKDSILASVNEETTRINSEIVNLNNNCYNKEEVDAMNETSAQDIIQVKKSVEGLMDSTSYQISILEERINNDVTEVKTENSFTFNKEGLTLDETGSPVKNRLDENGMEIINKTGSSQNTQFFSGYVTQELVNKNPTLASFLGRTITFTNDISVNNYIKMQNARWENVTHPQWGRGIGCFPGGDN